MGIATLLYVRSAPRKLKLSMGVTTPKYRIADGYLENVIDDGKDPAREPLLWRNFFFGKRQRRFWKNASFSIKAANSPLYLHPEILDDVLKYVFLPKDLIDGYRSFAKAK